MHICVCVPDLMEKPRPRDIAHVGAASGPGGGGWGRGWGGRLGSGVSLREEIFLGGGNVSAQPPPPLNSPNPPDVLKIAAVCRWRSGAGKEGEGGLKLGVSEGTGWGLQPGVPRFEAVAMVGTGEAPTGMSG